MGSKEIVLYSLWIAGGLMFIIYPGILLAGVMSLGAPKTEGTRMRRGFKLFLLITLSYPLIYFISYKCSAYFWEKNNFSTAVISTLPPIFVGILVLWVMKQK